VVFESAIGDVLDELLPIVGVYLLGLVSILRYIFAINARVTEVVNDHLNVSRPLDNHIRPLLDYLPDPILHLLDTLGVDAIFAVHVARLQKLAGLLDEVKDLLKGALVVNELTERRERFDEVVQAYVC